MTRRSFLASITAAIPSIALFRGLKPKSGGLKLQTRIPENYHKMPLQNDFITDPDTGLTFAHLNGTVDLLYGSAVARFEEHHGPRWENADE